MNIMIRKYNEADYLQIDKIFNLSKKIEMSFSGISMEILSINEDGNMQKLFTESEIFVAENSEYIIGFAGYKGSLISFMFVHPQHFNKGIAKQLFNTLSKNMEDPWLVVLKENIPAINLYKKYGFEVFEEFIGNYNGIKCNALKMKKRL